MSQQLQIWVTIWSIVAFVLILGGLLLTTEERFLTRVKIIGKGMSYLSCASIAHLAFIYLIEYLKGAL